MGARTAGGARAMSFTLLYWVAGVAVGHGTLLSLLGGLVEPETWEEESIAHDAVADGTRFIVFGTALAALTYAFA